jgi:trk system potassium uptake protein TrkA
MKIVIVGAGTVGFQIARQLVDEQKDVVLIEREPRGARHASNYLDCMVIQGEGNNPDVLKKAGVDRADFFIAVTDSDELNMIACGMIPGPAPRPFKIARVRNIDYSRSQVHASPFLGIDHIVNPEIEASRVISRSIEHGAVSDILFFEKTPFQMRNVSVPERSPLAGSSLKDIKQRSRLAFLVAFIIRNGESLIPHGDTVIQPGDHLYLVASEDTLEKLFMQTGKIRTRLDRFVIVGGGRIGSYVADYLLRQQKSDLSFLSRITSSLVQKWRRNVVIVDKDPETCGVLSERFSDALVMNEDISEEGIYEEGQFTDYDLVVTATGNQELNIITAVYAKKLGIKRSIAVVTKNSYVNIAAGLGIDVAVSRNNSMVNSILKLIRRGNIRNIYSFQDGRVEVMELRVENAGLSGTRIRDLRLPPQTLIVSVTRSGGSPAGTQEGLMAMAGNTAPGEERYLLPGGDTVIRKGDYVIVIARKETIGKIENIFTGSFS